MKLERMIELLEIEHECMLRCAHNECNRECQNCDLVQDDLDLHEMYTNVIHMLSKKMKKKKKPKKYIVYICMENACLKDVLQEHISVGTVWVKTKTRFRTDGVRLESVGDDTWCEMPKPYFKKCFRKAVVYA